MAHAVCGRFRRRVENGLFETLMRAVARRPMPTLAIIDTRSVEGIGV